VTSGGWIDNPEGYRVARDQEWAANVDSINIANGTVRFREGADKSCLG
jgi:hypothetical protein